MVLDIIIIIINIIMEKKINKKICVIGAGKWGQNHISTLDRLNYLNGVVESNPLAFNKIKSKYPNIKLFTNVSQAIKYGFDGFIIATPAETHFEIAKKILNSKNHVLVEKPFTTNIEDAEYLCKLAKKKNVNIMVGHLLLFHPAINKIKEYISKGKIGTLQYIYSNRLNLGTVRTHENVFWSFAPHDISILQFLTGSFPNKILSNGAAIIQKNIHDTTLTILEYPNNIKCHIYVSWLHPFKEHRLVVIGSKGMLTFEDSIDKKPLKFYNKKIIIDNCIPIEKNGNIKLVKYKKDKPLDMQLKYFVDHLDDRLLKKSNGENGLDVVRILTKSSDSLLQN